MAMRKLVIEGNGEIEVDGAEPLLPALARAGVAIDAPCGGKGRCGKCRVRVLDGAASPPEGRELELLSKAELDAGVRLACLARATGDMRIELPTIGAASILESSGFSGPGVVDPDVLVPFEVDPPVKAIRVELPPPTLEDRRDDERRLLDEIASHVGSRYEHPTRVGLAALADLAALARAPGPLWAVISNGEVARLARGDDVARHLRGDDVAPQLRGDDVARHLRGDEGPCLGVAVDLGTTTVVCRLIDVERGVALGAASELNAQRPFGADVVSRIAATIERRDGLASLAGAISSQLSRMVRGLAAKAGTGIDAIRCVSVAGNTTMLHLLARVPPAAIAAAPFTPAFLAGRTCLAVELGLDLDPGCVALLLPGLSAYVGADIVAGLAAIGMDSREGANLFLDVGTNGEIALGGARGIVACATAAGPAFEGAGIECGTGGVEGAIDSVWLENGDLKYTTIGGAPAVGLCGSGLVDALAAFLDCGLIDGTGRIADEDEAHALPPSIAALREETERGARLYLDRGREVFLSQADVRAAQLAKAAIAAGIDVLAARSAAGLEGVGRVFLAGGFGSYLDVRSAIRIGLLPAELRDRVLVAGNTSGEGAVAACLSSERLAAMERLRSMCEYIELSASPAFNEAYVERMMFPER